MLLVKPWVDGRKAHATAFAIYFKDLFLAFVYAMSIPFFVALYHAFKVLGYAGRYQVFSEPAVRSMRTIKRCALVIIGFVVVGEVFILKHDDKEDPGAGMFMGLAQQADELRTPDIRHLVFVPDSQERALP